MLPVQQNLKSILKTAGYSATSQRLAIFELLYGQEPLTMALIVKRSQDFADRASVYRTLALFESLGIVQRVNIGWKYKIELTDKFSEHHHHISCSHCGRVIAVNEEALEQFINQLAKQMDFKLQNHQLEIQGLCTHCQKLKRADRVVQNI